MGEQTCLKASPEDSFGDDSIIRRAVHLIYSLISLSHSIKVFPGKWRLIRTKLEELNSGLSAAEKFDSGDIPLLLDLVPAIVATADDCHDLARRCVDLSYSGKLLMQSDLDVIAARLDRHIAGLAGIYTAGILTHRTAIVVSKPSIGAGHEAMGFYARDLVTRMRIGDSDMKRQALRALNEAMEEEERYAKIVADEIAEAAGLLVSFLDSAEAEIQEAAANAAALLLGFDSCRPVLIGAGIAAPLIRVLESGAASGKEGAARALERLTHNSDNAWSVTAHGGVTALLRICGASSAGALVDLACRVLKNLAGVEEIVKFMVDEGAVTTFLGLARSRDQSLQINSIALLQAMWLRDESVRQSVIQRGGIHVLTRILDPKSSLWYSSKAKEAALRAIDGLMCFPSQPETKTKTKTQTQTPCVKYMNILIDSGYLNHLLYILRNDQSKTCSGVQEQQAMTAAGKMCRWSEDTKKAMGEAGFIPELAKRLDSKSFQVRETAAEALAALVSVPRNRRRLVHDELSLDLLLQVLDPEHENWSCSRKHLLSTVMELTSCNSGRRKIANSGHLKNIKKLAQREDSDAKKIVRKLSGNRLRSLLSGIW